MSVFKRKETDVFPDEVNTIIKQFSFKGAKVVGSSSLASQLYAGDYDMTEVVSVGSVGEFVSKFQTIVKDLYFTNSLYIGDIKCGRVVEWEVIPFNAEIRGGKVRNYNILTAKTKLENLRAKGIISAEEFRDAMPLLKEGKEAFLEAQKEIKFDTIRWTVDEVFQNHKVLRDGRVWTLADAIQTPGLCKIDAVAWILNMRYAEFSCLYEVRIGSRVLNRVNENLSISLKNDMLSYYSSGNYFKYAKRAFAYAKYKRDYDMGESLTTILNSELGRLYLLMSDIDTLDYLIENQTSLNQQRIHHEIDRFRDRLGTLYSMKEGDLMDSLQRLSSLPVKGAPFHTELLRVREKVYTTLQKDTKIRLKKIGLIPMPRSFQP